MAASNCLQSGRLLVLMNFRVVFKPFISISLITINGASFGSFSENGSCNKLCLTGNCLILLSLRQRELGVKPLELHLYKTRARTIRLKVSFKSKFTQFAHSRLSLMPLIAVTGKLLLHGESLTKFASGLPSLH